MYWLEAFMLVIAVSLDAFAASFAYGTNQVKIPLASAITMSAICTLTLALSLGLGVLFREAIPRDVARIVCIVLLMGLGIIKLFDSSMKAYIKRRKKVHRAFSFSILHLHFILHVYAAPLEADVDKSRSLSPLEAVSLAVALSLDGLAVGFGAAMTQLPIIIVVLLSFGTGLLAILGGCKLGAKAAELLHVDVSCIGGLLLILLALLKF